MSILPEQPPLDDIPTIRSLIALIGEEKFTLLSYHLGGKALFIAPSPGENSPLAAAIGLDAALEMGKIWGGMMFYVPVRAGRNAEICRLRRAGKSINAIAHQMRLDKKTVMRALEGAEDTSQLDLFGEKKPEQRHDFDEGMLPLVPKSTMP